MLEELSRVLGLHGFAVRAVSERGDELDLEVELVAAVAVCPDCGRASVEVKERRGGLGRRRRNHFAGEQDLAGNSRLARPAETSSGLSRFYSATT
jgi:hypothetical protein